MKRPSLEISRRSLLTAIGASGISLAVNAPARAAGLTTGTEQGSPVVFGYSHYGKWTKDDCNLPCFDADLEHHPAPTSYFCHLMSTGRFGAIVDQWGNVKFVTTDDGPVSLTPSTSRTRSGLYAILDIGGRTYSLVHSELNENKRIRFGTSYVDYRGDLADGDLRLSMREEIFAPPDKGCSLRGEFTFRNTGTTPISGTLYLQSDVFIRPGQDYENWAKDLRPEVGVGFAAFRKAHPMLGDVLFATEAGWTGTSRAHCLRLGKAVDLLPGQSLSAPVVFGYGKDLNVNDQKSKLAETTAKSSRNAWSKRLGSFAIPGLQTWIEDECKWSLGQLLSFEFFDPALGEHYLHLGGYDFFPDPDNPPDHLAYTIREAAENALVISHFEPALCRSTLRWMAQMQVESGDIPKSYDYTTTRLGIPSDQRDSDTEIWFLMALGEYIEFTGDLALLDETLAWFPASLPMTTMWDHAQRTFQWITEGVGVGEHGLIRILEGDWNDYLSTVGAGGKGESVMNSGMAARAFDMLAPIARHKGDAAFAVKLETWRDSLRAAVGRAFDKEWFVGNYTDDGKPICDHGDRLYLNSQSWAVLGGCGTKEQRRMALESAAHLCASRIGLTLMSKAYSSPPPPEISWCPIPAGEGENGGIWPQTIHWTVWAMAQEGLHDLALEVWTGGTLRNHSKEFPQVPLGIFNGPDCWSSRLAGSAEGWTQFQMFNRVNPVPQCPMISWQAFAMLMIANAKNRTAKS